MQWTVAFISGIQRVGAGALYISTDFYVRSRNFCTAHLGLDNTLAITSVVLGSVEKIGLNLGTLDRLVQLNSPDNVRYGTRPIYKISSPLLASMFYSPA